MNGKVVLRKNEVYDTVELDLASLPSGQYNFFRHPCKLLPPEFATIIIIKGK